MHGSETSSKFQETSKKSTMKEKKVDPHTLKEFIPKRKNQIFETVQNKIDYHNKNARNERFTKKEIDSKINKNYRILKSKIGDENEVCLPEKELLREGFDLRFINHFCKIDYKNKIQQVLGIYDFFYFIKQDSKEIVIIKHQDHDLY